MPWTRAAQRVLIVLAAVLALGAALGGRAARRPVAVLVSDDPGLDVRLDLNAASVADLETLPGVGTALAARIAAYRSANGPFPSVDDLGLVPGLGGRLVEALQPHLSVR